MLLRIGHIHVALTPIKTSLTSFDSCSKLWETRGNDVRVFYFSSYHFSADRHPICRYPRA